MDTYPPVPPTGTALKPAADLLSAAAGTEETRFNNLNNRGIALISASSLVTALVGVFAKDLFGTTYKSIRILVACGLILTLAALLAAVAVIVIGVLMPGRRSVFGDNPITSNPSGLTNDTDVWAIQWDEYRQVLATLHNRNARKASAINLAYWLYGSAALFGTASVGAVLICAFGVPPSAA